MENYNSWCKKQDRKDALIGIGVSVFVLICLVIACKVANRMYDDAINDQTVLIHLNPGSK